MFLRIVRAAITATMVVAASSSLSAQRVGETAPAFSNVDVKGKTLSSDGLKNRWVVLEWHNPGCEFTQKHYETGNLPRLQKEWTAKGVVWLTITSPSVPAARASAYLTSKGGTPSAILLDPAAATAKAFAAKTSPQMFVINPAGLVVYNGAIDDKPTADAADVASAKNFVAAALTEAMAGRPVTVASSRPYGCAVTYPGSTP